MWSVINRPVITTCNLKQNNMQAIIISDDQFQELINRIDKIESTLDGKRKNSHDQVLSNQEFLLLMNVSKRTAQTWRDEGKISFSQIGSKIYYRMSDVQNFLERTANKAFKLK